MGYLHINIIFFKRIRYMFIYVLNKIEAFKKVEVR